MQDKYLVDMINAAVADGYGMNLPIDSAIGAFTYQWVFGFGSKPDGNGCQKN